MTKSVTGLDLTVCCAEVANLVCSLTRQQKRFSTVKWIVACFSRCLCLWLSCMCAHRCCVLVCVGVYSPSFWTILCLQVGVEEPALNPWVLGFTLFLCHIKYSPQATKYTNFLFYLYYLFSVRFNISFVYSVQTSHQLPWDSHSNGKRMNVTSPPTQGARSRTHEFRGLTIVCKIASSKLAWPYVNNREEHRKKRLHNVKYALNVLTLLENVYEGPHRS